VGINRVKLSHNIAKLNAYLGERVPELSVTQGAPEFCSVTIETRTGTITIPGKLS
jgi:hypothetical protein